MIAQGRFGRSRRAFGTTERSARRRPVLDRAVRGTANQDEPAASKIDSTYRGDMADPSAAPPAGTTARFPPFEGAPTVLHLLDDLITEPGWFGTRGEWPLIWLDCRTPRRDLLRPLAARYHPLAPTAWVDAGRSESGDSAGPDDSAPSTHSNRPAEPDRRSPDQPDGIEQDSALIDPTGAVRLLRELVEGLRTARPRIPDRAFRRFDFVYWLVHQRLPEDGRPARRTLAVRHRRYLVGDPTAGELGRSLPSDSWWSVPLRLLLAVLVRVGYGLITRWQGHYRWLRRQRYLNEPVGVTDVLDLAVRVTRPRSGGTRQVELEKLLVHALLADLEHRGPARWWPPRFRRRSRQPVLLFVDNLTDTNAADRLLRLIAAVRNETGDPDPVVVVLSARPVDRVPPRTPRRAEAWVRDLTRRRRTSTRSAPDSDAGPPQRSEPPVRDDSATPSEPGRSTGDTGHGGRRGSRGSRDTRDPNEPSSGTAADAATEPGTAGDEGGLPPSSPQTTIELGRPGAEHLLDTWRVRHRNLRPDSRGWRLGLVVGPDLPPGQRAEATAARIQEHRPPRPTSLPGWAIATSVAVLLTVIVGGVGWWWYAGAQERCGVYLPASDTRLAEGRNGACVGVTDLTDHIFTPSRDAVFGQRTAADEHRQLRRAQERIRHYNEQVVDSDRPYVTVIYFGSIADRDAAGGTVAAPRAELQGLAIAQAKRIEDTKNATIPQKRPLLRVLVANAGPAMSDAPRVARMIDELYQSTLDREDPIVGVVGLGQSVSELEDAMRVLRPSGLPLIGSITSYDGLPEVSGNYFQVGPNNQRQAEVAAYYARRTFPDTRELLVIRSSAQNDTYSRNLADRIGESFERAYADVDDFTVRPVQYETAPDGPGLPPERLGQRICAHQGLVFFAGRAQDLAGVAPHMRGCIRAGSTPEILAGDDVSRAVLEGALDGSGLELTYIPLATSATDERGNCTDGRTASWMSIYRLNEKLFDGTCPDSSDGRMLLIYDAVEVVLQATDMIADSTDDMSAVSGPGVRTAVEGIRGPNAIDGFSGLIDFGRSRDNRVPVRKAVSVLRISDGDASPELLLRCGPLYAGDTSAPRSCPR